MNVGILTSYYLADDKTEPVLLTNKNGRRPKAPASYFYTNPARNRLEILHMWLSDESCHFDQELLETNPLNAPLQPVDQDVFQMVFELGRSHLTATCSSLQKLYIPDQPDLRANLQNFQSVAKEVIFNLPGVVNIWLGHSCNNPGYYLGRIDWTGEADKLASLKLIKEMGIVKKIKSFGINSTCIHTDLSPTNAFDYQNGGNNHHFR